ncbi:MAG: DbpA RNA binding domain-containing protein [Sphaerochaetaceae bacterium]|nr:DbpA RNA binding domain-containing protein [Sphaerochaetaceae bacterium]
MAEENDYARGQEIKELVEEMKLYNRPEEIEEMKKLIKKNVPFSMRGYLLAYLYLTKSGKTNPQARKAKEYHQEPENATAYYINIGRMSKSNPAEIISFLCEKGGLSKEDIITVAYKQNYSFVYIANNKCEGIIEKVNNQSFKGRKVKMSLKRDKDEQ